MRTARLLTTTALLVACCIGCVDSGSGGQGIPSVAGNDRAPGSEQEPPLSPDPGATAELESQGAGPAAAARVESIQRLLEQGLDANAADPDGRTALMMAAFEGYTDVAELLLDHGAEVDHLDGLGRTALMYASSGPFPQTVELLIARGADVNRIDSEEGWSALMLAAAEGLRPVVEVLLRSGADPDVQDKDGDKAIDHARQRGQDGIVTLLSSRS